MGRDQIVGGAVRQLEVQWSTVLLVPEGTKENDDKIQSALSVWGRGFKP